MSTSMTPTLRRERTNTISSQASTSHLLAPPPTPTFSSKPFDLGNAIVIYDGTYDYSDPLGDDFPNTSVLTDSPSKPSLEPPMFNESTVLSYYDYIAYSSHTAISVSSHLTQTPTQTPLQSQSQPQLQSQTNLQLSSTTEIVGSVSSEFKTPDEPSVLRASVAFPFEKMAYGEDTTADSTDVSEEDTAFNSDDDTVRRRSSRSAKSRNRCIRRDTMWAMTDNFNDGEINRQLVVQLNALVRSETLYVRTLTMLRDAFWRSIDEERIAEGNGLRRSGRRLLNALTSAVHRRKPGLRRKSVSSDESSSDRAEPNTTANGDQLMSGSDTFANRWCKPSWCVCGRREITERGMCALHGLFGNIAPLTECHTHFLLKMRQLQPLSEHLDEFFPLLYEHLLTCKIYAVYLKEHMEALVNFENMLLCDERLSKEIARCEAQVGVKLRALLTKPVERPWYYAHVVQVIFNNYLPKAKLPAQALAACVLESTNLTNELEMLVQQVTQLKQIASLQRNFLQLPAPFLHLDQKIIQEQSIQFRRYRKGNWQRCHYWLFSDRILIGREKDDNTYVCEICIPLNRCTVTTDKHTNDQFVAILQVSGISLMFQMQLESSGLFSGWISYLEAAIDRAKANSDVTASIPCGHGCLPRNIDPFLQEFHNFTVKSSKNIV